MQRTLTFILATLAIFSCSLAAPNEPPGNPLDSSPANDAAFPSSNWEHLRLDEEELTKLGEGSIDKGLSIYGQRGFRLFAVTTAGDAGKSGWHIFKRRPWNLPGPRPKYDYRRMDTDQIQKLGNGQFAPGMSKVEKEGWEIVAFTTMKDGGIGFYYLERMTENH